MRRSVLGRVNTQSSGEAGPSHKRRSSLPGRSCPLPLPPPYPMPHTSLPPLIFCAAITGSTAASYWMGPGAEGGEGREALVGRCAH